MKSSHVLTAISIISVPLWYAYRSIGAPNEILLGQIVGTANSASQIRTPDQSQKRCFEDVAAGRNDLLSLEAERKRYISLTKPFLDSSTPSSATLSAEQFKLLFDVRYQMPIDERDLAEHLKTSISDEVGCASMPGLNESNKYFHLRFVHERRLNQSLLLLEQVERRKLMEELVAYWQDSFPRTREGQRQREHFKSTTLALGSGH